MRKLEFTEDEQREMLTIIDRRRKGTKEVKVKADALFRLLSDYDLLLEERRKEGKLMLPPGDYRI